MHSWVSSWKGCDFYNQFDNGRTFQPRIVFNSSYVFHFHRFIAKRRQNKSLSEKITTFACQISRHVEIRTWVTFPVIIYDVVLSSGWRCWTNNFRSRSRWWTTIWKWVVMTFQISESWDLSCTDSLLDNYIPNSHFVAFRWRSKVISCLSGW